MRTSKHLPCALSAARRAFRNARASAPRPSTLSCGAAFNAWTPVAARFNAQTSVAACISMHIRRLRRAFQCTNVGCGALFNAQTSVAARFSMHIRQLRRAFQCTNVGCGALFNAHTSVAPRISIYTHPLQRTFQCTNTGCGARVTHDELLWRRIKAMQGYTSDHAFPRRALPTACSSACQARANLRRPAPRAAARAMMLAEPSPHAAGRAIVQIPKTCRCVLTTGLSYYII